VNLTVSQPIKILALVGLIGIIGLGASTMVLGRGASSGSATEDTVQVHRRATPATSVATATPATPAKKATPATPAAAATPAKPAGHAAPATRVKTPATTHVKTHKPAVTHHKAAKHVVARHRGNLVFADLPAPLQWELSQHKVVVVSFYNPNADVDSISVAEAHQGAKDAGAGFLLVSVLDNKVAGILTALLPGGGLLPAPGIIVYRAPGNIALRIDGFADRVSVAQAAQNALSGETMASPAPAASAATAAAPLTAPPATVTP
jgi:hypothetical protein